MSHALFDLSGKVAVVTGASRGLGQYFGRALARAGADLVITSRNADDLSDFQGEIESLDRKALALELDKAVDLVVSGEFIYGVAAFLEKKPPEFPDE